MEIPAPIIKAIKDRLQEKWKMSIEIREHTYIRGIQVVTFNEEEICEIFQDDNNGLYSLVMTYEVDVSQKDDIKTRLLEWKYEYSDPNSFDIDKIVNQVYTVIRLHIDLMEDLSETESDYCVDEFSSTEQD